MSKQAEKAVIIVSGGIDSTVLLYKTIDKGYDVKTLTFLYGQRHVKESGYAEAICARLGVPNKIIDLSSLKVLLSGSALTDSSVDVPEVPETAEHYETLQSTIVPNRNAIFLSIAVGYAVSTGAENVYFGAHFSDRGVYPDCRSEFVDSFQSAERLATDIQGLNIKAPFVNSDKSEIVKLGSTLGVPFEQTWTCYKGGRLHCGTCSSCRERKRAFQESGVTDPTEYAK